MDMRYQRISCVPPRYLSYDARDDDAHGVTRRAVASRSRGCDKWVAVQYVLRACKCSSVRRRIRDDEHGVLRRCDTDPVGSLTDYVACFNGNREFHRVFRPVVLSGGEEFRQDAFASGVLRCGVHSCVRKELTHLFKPPPTYHLQCRVSHHVSHHDSHHDPVFNAGGKVDSRRHVCSREQHHTKN